MKKLLVLLLSLLMVFSLAACNNGGSANGGEEEEAPTYDANAVDLSSLKLANVKEYTYPDSSEIDNLDYVTTALATNHEINANFVDGLVETDKYGTYVGSVAESWESNEDASVWTFHLRDGVQWVTSNGEVYADVKAEDFVTGLRHAAEFQSGTSNVAANVWGFTEYMNTGDFSDEAWEKVGIKALDEKTVQFTMGRTLPVGEYAQELLDKGVALTAEQQASLDAFNAVNEWNEYNALEDKSTWGKEAIPTEPTDEQVALAGELTTLSDQIPYFYTMVEYTTFYPINRDFLESKGEGCKLGSPDVTACTFGQPVPDSILYNGAFILDSFDVQSSTVLRKNENYWDKDNVNLDKVTIIFDNGSDPYSTIRGFEQNTYAAAAIATSWGDEMFNAMKAKYDGYLSTSLPNAYAFGVVFNYNRVSYNLTNYASDAALAENTKNAIRNENFRKALKAAFDVPAYLMTTAPEEVAMATLRNMNGVPNLVATSDGTQYGTLVEKEYAALTGETVSLADGQWPWLSKEKALAYIDAAKAEGIEFPVHLDMLVIETSVNLTKRAQSMKQSIEENTDGQIIIELVMKDQDTVYNVAYYGQDWSEADYDISTFTGWGPDYVDPKTFTEIYSPVDGYYMQACGLTDKGLHDNEEFGSDDDVKTAVGFYEYEELYRAADSIKSDLDARYAAFAKADAYLLAHALYVPTSQQARTLRVSHAVPFSGPFSTGVSQYKLKGFQLQEDIVTTEQYDSAKAAWEAGN